MDKQKKEFSKIINEANKQMMANLYGLNDTDRSTLTKFKPKKIIFNPPTTIVYWWDGTKTVVKCSEDEEFVEEVGLAMAVVKRLYGDRSKFLKFVEKAYRQPKNEKRVAVELKNDGTFENVISDISKKWQSLSKDKQLQISAAIAGEPENEKKVDVAPKDSRTLGDVISNIDKKWQSLSEIKRFQISTAIAGEPKTDFMGLPGWIVDKAVEVLQNAIDEETERNVKYYFKINPTEWCYPYHFGWGMWIRNILRDKVCSDDKLPSGNWDDYYVPLIELSLGLRKNEKEIS